MLEGLLVLIVGEYEYWAHISALLIRKKKYNVKSKNADLCRSFLRIKGNAKILCLYSVRLEGDGKLRRLFFWKFIKLQGRWNQAYDG